jgi:rhodanese-related sulfurtransferase
VNYLGKQKAAGNLSKLAGADGLLRCVFICCDLPYQYIDEYFDKVNSDEFRPIKNQVSSFNSHYLLRSVLIIFQNLANVDLYRYDEAWELQPTEAIAQYSKNDSATSSTVLIDLRKPEDFVSSHIPGSYNLPLQSLNGSSPNPFFDADVLERQWREIDNMFSSNTISAYDLTGKNVGVICYDGDTARVATSILRAKGITASSIKGGFCALTTQLPNLRTTSRVSFQQWSGTLSSDDQEIRAGSLSPSARPRPEVLVNAP